MPPWRDRIAHDNRSKPAVAGDDDSCHRSGTFEVSVKVTEIQRVSFIARWLLGADGGKVEYSPLRKQATVCLP